MWKKESVVMRVPMILIAGAFLTFWSGGANAAQDNEALTRGPNCGCNLPSSHADQTGDGWFQLAQGQGKKDQKGKKAGSTDSGDASSGTTASSPTTTAVCGNGMVEANEQCDVPDLKGQTCSSASGGTAPNGTLQCSTTCRFDTSGCAP
jgi:hypothetical protein